MDTENRIINLVSAFSETKTANLRIEENIESDEDSIILEIEINQNKFCGKGDNYFDALVQLRRCLERENIQIMCNGAGKNVYPSPMQFSMGNTRKAYKTYLGKQAKMADLVDIFDCEDGMVFVSIDEQMKYNTQWISSF
jgi:hypothetical protein